MTKKRAALYARYSSDLQKDRSIDDQLALCRVHAIRASLEVVTTFVDRAKSGASMNNRDGLWEMMQAAKRGDFDVIVIESLDRLSRDQADLPQLHKRLEFAGVKILTCNDGETTKMHVGIRGLVSSIFLSTLADTVRRGHAGRVSEGKFPGARVYGYRCITGKPGEREIDPEQAAIVLRIFREYAAGKSPRTIAGDLTREGITSPSGTAVWSNQCLTGGRLRQGMIGNRLYIGEIRWNRTRVFKNPETEAEIRRATPAEDHVGLTRLQAAVPRTVRIGSTEHEIQVAIPIDVPEARQKEPRQPSIGWASLAAQLQPCAAVVEIAHALCALPPGLAPRYPV